MSSGYYCGMLGRQNQTVYHGSQYVLSVARIIVDSMPALTGETGTIV